jgi:urease accessory protein
MNSPELYRLISWLSPSFPVGAYTFSHGLEYAADAGLVSSSTELQDWIETVLRYGTGRVDAMLIRAAYDASEEELQDIIELASAMKGTSELSKESRSQGQAFAKTVASAWHCDLSGLIQGEGIEAPYSVAVALACKGSNIPVASVLTAYLHAFVSNLVSAAMRLIPIGQTDGQKIIAGMADVVAEVVDDAMRSPMTDIGSSTPMVDWASMQHESQHTRLFRS